MKAFRIASVGSWQTWQQRPNNIKTAITQARDFARFEETMYLSILKQVLKPLFLSAWRVLCPRSFRPVVAEPVRPQPVRPQSHCYVVRGQYFRKYCPAGNIFKNIARCAPISWNIEGNFKHKILQNIFSSYNKYIYIYMAVGRLPYIIASRLTGI